ncbi:MAG: glycoside hydrolase family 44 protein [Frankiaceae bacterium]
MVATAGLLLAGATALPGTAAQAAGLAGPALAVDAAADRHPISPDIYGLNFADPKLGEELRLPVDRWGGNRATRYNYLNNTSNSGSDWYFLSHPEDQSADEFVGKDRAIGAKTVMTVPITGRVTKAVGDNGEHQCGFSVAKYGPQQDTDPWHRDCGNGRHADGSVLTGNDPGDISDPEPADYTGDFVRHLVGRYGDAAHGGVPVYQLDNEPALWQWTHRDIHPQRLSYDELWTKTETHAAAVKAADPTAATLGPSDWGWCAYFFAPVDDPNYACATGPDRQAHGDTPLAEWYLAQARGYEQQHHVRILDYLDEHYYPQANEVALSPAGDAARQALRLRTTRSLWDPSYQDESWIPDHVMLIPRMRDWVARNYPGTKLAVTEYNFGGLESINGALTEADVLGIFAREGVDLATLWEPPKADQPGAFALRMYRNYDGNGGSFGDTWARATSTDQDKVAVYAATRRFDGALTTLVINKTGDELTSPLTVAGADTTQRAQVWRYSAADPTAIHQDADVAVAGGTAQLTLPGNSLTLVVLPPAPHGTAPAVPTGVSAKAGDGQAEVSWTAPPDDDSSLITSYTVTAHHDGTDGPSSTVRGYPPAPHATVSGLGNGTAYSFTVAATNAVGTGSASAASVPVTPIGKPGAPTNVKGSAADGTATVSWTPPADTGGSPITGYTVTAEPGGITTTAAGTDTSVSVPGLTNGIPYTFTVTATNAVGTGPPSAPSDPPAIPCPGPDQCLLVKVDSKPNPSALGEEVTFTVSVSKGGKRAVAGGVDIWDDTAQHYAAYGCPADDPPASATASTYTCKATFDNTGLHKLTAHYVVFWPDADWGQSTPYSQAVGVDLPAQKPTVTITSRPADPTNSRTAEVAFTVTPPDAATSCQLDGKDAAPCTSPVKYTGLSEGKHHVTVTATDSAGTDSAGADWTVVLPSAAVTLTASPSTLTFGQAATLTAQIKVGGVPVANVGVRFCGPAGQSCTVVRADRTGTARLTEKPDRASTYIAAVDAGTGYSRGISGKVTVTVKPMLLFLSARQPAGGAVLAVVLPDTNQLQLQLWHGRTWVTRTATVATPFAQFNRLPHGTYGRVVPAQNGRVGSSGASFRL